MRKIHFETRIITAVNEKPTVSITFNCLILSNILSFARVLFKNLFINVDHDINLRAFITSTVFSPDLFSANRTHSNANFECF